MPSEPTAQAISSAPDSSLSPYLRLLKNRIDLRRVPFSDRGSRLLLFHQSGNFDIRLAERWFKREGQLSGYRDRPPLITDWQFTDGEGNRLPVQVTTYPHRVNCQTPIGNFSLTFVDTETLMVTLPAGRCGMAFRANLDHSHT